MADSENQRELSAVGACLIFAIVVAALELLIGSTGALLLALAFWVSLAQGSVALVAAGELSNAKWILPVKKRLLSTYQMILVIAILFFLMWRRIEAYPWAGHGGVWLNANFFMIRNIAVLLLTFWAGRTFACVSIAGGKTRRRYAVLYLLSFVVSQSLIAFDWVMSFAYPWISTLFGGYFFVEAMYAGIALSAIYSILPGVPTGETDSPATVGTLRDAATLLFGFSLLWAGLFYSQFLVIWYGNIPEEAGYMLRRIYDPPYSLLSKIILGLMFVLPFFILIARRTKSTPPVVLAVAAAVLAGLCLERILFLHPVVGINSYLAIGYFSLFAILFITLVRKKSG